MLRRLARLLVYLVIAVMAVVVLGLLALHTNPVQSRVLGWSIGELERRFDLDLTADDLHYNLAARRVTMTNVRLAAVGHRDEPFFSANAVMVKLPWAAYRGRLRFDEVSIDTGSVAIARDAQGVSNLPPGRGTRPADAPPRRIDIRGLVIRQLDFSYVDRQRDIEIRTPRIRTDLAWEAGQGARGPFAIDNDVLVRVRERRVDIKPVTGTMVFEGVDVGLENVLLDTTDGRFTFGGTIARAFDRPNLDLMFKGTTSLEQSSRWARPPVRVAGIANIEAHMTGAPSAFTLDARVVAPAAEVGTEPAVAIDAQAQLTPNRVSVSRASIKPATGGEVEATVDVPFGAQSPWWIDAKYSGLDAAAAFRLAGVRPLPFGAALSGTARIDRAAGEPFRLVIRNKATPRVHAGTAPLQGDVEFIVDGGRWRANQRHQMGTTRVDGQIGGAWNRQATTQSTFEGRLAVATADVAEAARYAALFGFPAPAIVTGTRGPMTADVALSGTFTEPRFTGSARSDGVQVPSIGNAAITTDFDASRRLLSASNIEAALGEGESRSMVRGDVRADFVTRQLSGALRIESPSASDLLTALPEALRLRGPLTATATLSGTVDAPDIVADVEGRDLTLGGQPIASLTAKARVIDGGITAESVTLRQPAGGRLQATGRYAWGTRTYSVDLSGQNLEWQGTLARLGDAQARFALKFGGAGSIDRPTGEGVIDFAISGGLAGALIDRGLLNVRLNGESVLLTGQVPSLGAFITATVAPRHPFNYDAVVVMNRIALAPIVTLAGLEQSGVQGTASLSASAKGSLADAVRSDVFVNLQDLDAEVAGVPLDLVVPARIAWDGARLSIDNLDVTVGSGRLLASGDLGQGGIKTARWEATYKGELGELLKIGRPFGVPASLDGSGPISVAWRSTGGLDQSTADAHLEQGSVAWAELPSIRNLRLDAAFDGKTLNVSQFTGQWQDGGIEGTASIPRGVLQAQETGGALLTPAQVGFAKVRVNGLSEAAFAPWLSGASLATIDGRLSATLDARITRPSLEGIAATLIVDEADWTLAGVSVRQAHASVFEFDGGVMTVRDLALNAGGSPLTVTGTARLVPTAQQGLNLDINGTADLQLLSAFAPTLAASGEARLKVGIGGNLKMPVFNGRVDLANAELAIRDPRVVISDLSGTIALDGQRVLFDSLSGTANGGALTVDGGFLLEGFTPASGGVTFIIERAALEYPEGLQSEANALVTLSPGPTGWSLTGDITVERSAYNETISIAGLIAARGLRPPSASDDEGWIDRLRLNLFVTTLQDLAIDNNYGRLEAGAALRVGGTVADPVLAGRVTLREGSEVYLAGNTFHLSRGSISFANPFRIVPEFDVELRTQVGGTEITLTIDGPLDRLRTDVRSSDSLVDSREAVSMLFGGFQGEDALTLLSAELLGATGRAIGLDTLRVERGFDIDEFRADPGLIATEVDPSTRLTLSKRLRPDVELTLSQSLRESGGLSAIISYKPRRNVELRAVSRDNVDRSVALRHEITFGGGGATVSPGEASPAATVADITISGDPQVPREELIARLELDPGDDFAFNDWQRDIDRLREVYHDRQHYEVRIRGTRRVSDDGMTVALDYAIAPGPLTELTIEGHALEPGLERDIREVWRRTIFDRFLLEEIRARVTRHLVEENFIGSSVEVAVTTPTPELKRVAVTINAGSAVSKRAVRYRGNATFSGERLDEEASQSGAEIDGWIEPRLLAERITNFYRAQGYLAVTVKAEPPGVEGGVGILPVQIDEGARFVVASVTLPGVTPARIAAVESELRLDRGTPFVTAEVDAARERVEALYAREGFNTVQIEVDSRPDLERKTVDVSFAVLEGVQQVLREVTTSGATRTRDGVIRRALRLRIGEPVNLADWSQARKRLYDTNVFRQVDIEPVPIEPTTAESAAGIQPIRALVTVAEYPVWRLRYGAQLIDETREVPDPDGDTRLQSLGVLADLQNQNLFGRAVTAGIAGRYERNRQAGSLFTSTGTFFGLPLRSSGFIFTSRQRFFTEETSQIIDQRVGLSLEQRWRPFRTSEVIYSYRFERSHTFDPNATADNSLIPFDVVVKVARINAAVLFDRRDDPSDPTRGWFNSANYEQAVRSLGSEYGNAKLFFQQSGYLGLGRMVLAGRAQFGSAFGDESLIVSERFLLGGATTVRGYGEDTLGPRGFDGLPAGGDALLNFNGEFRFPVRGWVQGVAFVDAGNVFVTRGDLSLRDLSAGYGVGLRLASPFAMLRIDFGIPAQTIRPDRPAHQFKSGRWYFGVGHIF